MSKTPSVAFMRVGGRMFAFRLFSLLFFLGVWVCWFATCLLDDRRFGVVWCGVVVDKNGWVIVVLSGG